MRGTLENKVITLGKLTVGGLSVSQLTQDAQKVVGLVCHLKEFGLYPRGSKGKRCFSIKKLCHLGELI